MCSIGYGRMNKKYFDNIPPKKGKSHVLRIIRELLEFKSKSKKTDINVPLKFVSNILKDVGAVK